MGKKNILFKLFYIALLYFFMFYPPVVIGGYRLYCYQIVRAVAIVYILFNLGEFRSFVLKFSNVISLMGLIILYSIIRSLLSGAFEVALQNIIGIFTLIIVPYFFVSYGRKIGIVSFDGLIVPVLIAATIAVFLSVASFLIPGVNSFFRDTIIQYGELGVSEGYEERGYGWGLYMTSSYSFVIAIVTSIGLYYKEKAKWFIFVVPFALIACLINARTGVLISLVGMFIYFMATGANRLSILLLLAGIWVYQYLDQILLFVLGNNENTYIWVQTFVNETTAYSQGDFSSGTVNSLIYYGWHFPQSLPEWLLGIGESLFSKNSLHIHSDIGFINQLFFGGLVYWLMLYSLVYMVYSTFKRGKQKAMAWFIIASFFIINFKGDFVFNTPHFGLIMIMYYSFLYTQKKSPRVPISRNICIADK